MELIGRYGGQIWKWAHNLVCFLTRTSSGSRALAKSVCWNVVWNPLGAGVEQCPGPEKDWVTSAMSGHQKQDSLDLALDFF